MLDNRAIIQTVQSSIDWQHVSAFIYFFFLWVVGIFFTKRPHWENRSKSVKVIWKHFVLICWLIFSVILMLSGASSIGQRLHRRCDEKLHQPASRQEVAIRSGQRVGHQAGLFVCMNNDSRSPSIKRSLQTIAKRGCARIETIHPAHLTTPVRPIWPVRFVGKRNDLSLWIDQSLPSKAINSTFRLLLLLNQQALFFVSYLSYYIKTLLGGGGQRKVLFFLSIFLFLLFGLLNSFPYGHMRRLQ